ncbi:MAG TPA: M14 family zinc carboxypeptidase, partial [Chryseosolibacter sp.]|nr:M14 family zinc carboxypeptidase [Chryseosolibacter sp.]
PAPIQSEIPEGSAPEMKVTKIGENHYKVESTQTQATGGFYPLIKFTHLKGKTVTIDLCGQPFDHFGNTTMQYGYIKDLSDLKSFESPTTPDPKPQTPNPDYSARPRTGDWAALPDTSRQSWHFFKHERRDPGVLSLTQTFTEDTAYITDRVPYTPEYNQNYLNTLRNNPYVEVVEIGKSDEGRSLKLVKTRSTAEDERKKPCVLIYAREHCDEQDASWVAQGAIDFLASDNSQAKSVRQHCTFFVIPLFDPDGAIAGTHENIINGFTPGQEHPETLAYGAWFKKWVDDGKRLDICISAHDPPPSSAFHVACPMMEPQPDRLAASEKLHGQVRAALTSAGFLVRHTPWTTGQLPNRFSGWLSHCYGTLPIPYEINSLTPKRELGLAEIRQLGRCITVGADTYLSSNDGRSFLARVDDIRRSRASEWSIAPQKIVSYGPIESEDWIAQKKAMTTIRNNNAP